VATTTYIPYGDVIEATGQGIQFMPEYDGTGVTIIVEVRDPGARARDTREHYVTLTREDWLAITDHLSRVTMTPHFTD
jgi:hypothetical protein